MVPRNVEGTEPVAKGGSVPAGEPLGPAGPGGTPTAGFTVSCGSVPTLSISVPTCFRSSGYVTESSRWWEDGGVSCAGGWFTTVCTEWWFAVPDPSVTDRDTCSVVPGGVPLSGVPSLGFGTPTPGIGSNTGGCWAASVSSETA
nr:hypothetical protein [Streptomyces sp. RPA4-2]QIY64923.1 hypothetical protein HEP85_29080 [Streptomyces sp. RPA4-2]